MSNNALLNATHAVIYTDGGCKPTSRGFGGWGIHGYFYIEEEPKQGTGNGRALPTTGGYVMGSGGKPAITLLGYVDGFGALIPESTNNVAELMALIKALHVAIDQKIQHLHLIMDSKYVMQGMKEWLPNWIKNNFIRSDQTPVANIEYWKEIHALLKRCEEAGIAITTQWVKGHTGNLGNETADQHANRGIVAGRNGLEFEVIKITDAKGYWNSKAERSRMFSHPNWFFGSPSEDTGVSKDGRHIYYLGDPREDDELLGKKIADATFSVLYLKDPDPALSVIREAAAKLYGNFSQGLTIGCLDKIFNADLYNEILEYGDTLLVRDPDRSRILSSTDDILAKEIRPIRLAYNAIDALTTLEHLLEEHLFPVDNSKLRRTDITHLLYDFTESKKKTTVKIKPEISSSTRFLEVDATYCLNNGDQTTKVKLTLGLDLPDRNTLAALADQSTKVTLLTWPESGSAFRYATVVESNGDAGIWSGIYSNLHLLQP